MAEYTTLLQGRDPRKLKLTEEEAWDMWAAGFRFSIFDPTNDDYRLSIPWKTLIMVGKDIVTLQQ